MKSPTHASGCHVEVAFLAPRAFFAATPMSWEITRARLIRIVAEAPKDAPEKWEMEEAITDLRWWEDRIRMKVALAEEKKVRVYMPSERELASWWGWSKQRVRRLLDARWTWADPAHRDSPARRRRKTADPKPPLCAVSGAAVGQPWGSVGALMGQLVTDQPHQCVDIGAAVGHSRGTHGAEAGHHMRASSQDTTPQITREREEGVEEIPPARMRPSPPPSVSASKAVRLRWSSETVLTAWADAWKKVRGGKPCRGRKDGAHASDLARALHASETSRPGFIGAAEGYLAAQAAGDAFPATGVPMVGHFKRVWADYLPGARSAPQRQPPPWEAPYTSSRAPMWSSSDARKWVARNQGEVNAIWAAIKKFGGGEKEFRLWLSPRVQRVDDVLTALREVA